MRRTDQALGYAGGDSAQVGRGALERRRVQRRCPLQRRQGRGGAMAAGAVGMGEIGQLGARLRDFLHFGTAIHVHLVLVFMVAEMLACRAAFVPANAGRCRPGPLDRKQNQQEDQHESMHEREYSEDE